MFNPAKIRNRLGGRHVKHMRRHFFINNLLLHIVPLLIPVVVLGSLSFYITSYYLKSQLHNNSSATLRQAYQNVDLMISELDSLNLEFSTNSSILSALDSILNSKSLSLEDASNLRIIKGFISSPANARPYIHSIYIYLDNPYSRFISTVNGVNDIETYIDKDWFKSYREKGEESFWVTRRDILNYSFENSRINILTLYKKLYHPGLSTDGVIVLNIYTDYINKMINSIVTLTGQSIVIFDKEKAVLFSTPSTPDTVLSSLPYTVDWKDSSNVIVNENGKRYVLSSITSNKYGWYYCLITSYDEYFMLPNRIAYITGLLILMTLIVGFFLTYRLTQRTYKGVHEVLELLEKAERGDELPSIPDKVIDEYQYIVQNIIRTFIEQNYLKLTLSQKKYELQIMEFRALQSQINPHFLFNTLETINWRATALTNGQNDVTAMINLLSDILKYSLAQPKSSILLSEEIKYTSSYLKIQEIRYRDTFSVIWDYDDDVLDFEVIKLIIQPLVENCIYHGIRECLKPKKAIKIRVTQRNEILEIAVIDNGFGIAHEQLVKIRQNLMDPYPDTEHVGLINTARRLKAAYGENYGISIRSKFGLGTAVYAVVPAVRSSVPPILP